MILKQGWCPVNIMAITWQHYFEAELLSLNTMDILGWIILATGLSHALCDVHHHPWLLPLDRVETSLPTPCEVLTVRNVSRHCQMSRRKVVGKTHCFRIYRT